MPLQASVAYIYIYYTLEIPHWPCSQKMLVWIKTNRFNRFNRHWHCEQIWSVYIKNQPVKRQKPSRSGAHGEMVAEPSDDALCHHQIHFVPPLGTSESLKRRWGLNVLMRASKSKTGKCVHRFVLLFWRIVGVSMDKKTWSLNICDGINEKTSSLQHPKTFNCILFLQATSSKRSSNPENCGPVKLGSPSCLDDHPISRVQSELTPFNVAWSKASSSNMIFDVILDPPCIAHYKVDILCAYKVGFRSPLYIPTMGDKAVFCARNMPLDLEDDFIATLAFQFIPGWFPTRKRLNICGNAFYRPLVPFKEWP